MKVTAIFFLMEYWILFLQIGTIPAPALRSILEPRYGLSRLEWHDWAGTAGRERLGWHGWVDTAGGGMPGVAVPYRNSISLFSISIVFQNSYPAFKIYFYFYFEIILNPRRGFRRSCQCLTFLL